MLAAELLIAALCWDIMGLYIQVLLFIIAAVILFWFGYTLFFRIGVRSVAGNYGFFGGFRGRQRRKREKGYPGAPQTCPVCSSKLDGGELVKSLAFPSLNGGRDRMMHIRGCPYCLNGEQKRICPVCRRVLAYDEVLICRMFERRRGIFGRPHVHVLGCTRCRNK